MSLFIGCQTSSHAAQSPVNALGSDSLHDFTQPPPKRQRLSTNESTVIQSIASDLSVLDEVTTTSSVPRHPFGVRPLGNLYAATKPNIRNQSGSLAYLPDELLLRLFEAFDAVDLLRLGATCKALFALTRSEELWKTIFIACPPRSFQWRGSWRATFLALPASITEERPIDCTGLYSDALYRPFHCAHASLDPFVNHIPRGNEIARLGSLSPENFASDGWADKPFILTDPVKSWGVYKNWTADSLLQRYTKHKFRAEAVDWPLETYIDYMNDCANDECPLYLFDHSFVEKMNLRVPEDELPGYEIVSADDSYDYTPPLTFAPDLFTHLDSQRPHHRWLILGPARSGSTFHKDPNATSAWNAVLFGSKYWIMFPPESPPPGVFVSADQSEVTSPLSITEWLLSFHAEARKASGCREGICYQGEVLHVPSGWWHLVINLDVTLALTQNFVPRTHLGQVLSFLRDKPEQVSGFSRNVTDPFGLFVDRLTEHCGAELVAQGLEESCQYQNEVRSLKKSRGKWEALVEGDGNDNAAGQGAGFSFGFGFGAGDDEDDNEEKQDTNGADDANDVDG